MNRRDDFRRDGSRQPISREELYERQREQQAKQAERKSWVEELNEEFPASDFVFGVSPVLAAFRAKRRTIHRLYIQDSMEMSKRKDSNGEPVAEALSKDDELTVSCSHLGNQGRGGEVGL